MKAEKGKMISCAKSLWDNKEEMQRGLKDGIQAEKEECKNQWEIVWESRTSGSELPLKYLKLI